MSRSKSPKKANPSGLRKRHSKKIPDKVPDSLESSDDRSEDIAKTTELPKKKLSAIEKILCYCNTCCPIAI